MKKDNSQHMEYPQNRIEENIRHLFLKEPIDIPLSTLKESPLFKEAVNKMYSEENKIMKRRPK